ncbi:MAG TPA: hypothetical protein VGQ36_09115 [Thermoanaerobaculia bacterium]|jgi:hypothetical protein|nr:hypothetical protein [Thermoanaerobaculia bacterium]
MKRTIFDTLRRGLDNAIVNWGLIVIRVVEVFVFALIAIGAAMAILVPIFVSIGIELTDIDTPDQLESLFLSLLDKWVLLIWIFVGISVLLLIFIAVHSFVEAGCARVAVDADRIAGPAKDVPRSSYRVFSMQRWLAGAKDGWWTVFWIYNFAWGVAGLILLIPLVPTAAIMFIARETPAAIVATGCIGLALTLMLMMVVGVVTSMWTTRAITDWAVDRSSASSALSGAWTSIKSDLGRHLVVAIAVILIAMAGSSFFASFSYMAAFGEMLHQKAVFNLFSIPLRLIATLLNWAFSAFVTSWYLAAYAALAVEKKS